MTQIKARSKQLSSDTKTLASGIDLALQHPVTLPPDLKASEQPEADNLSMSLLFTADGIEFEGAKPVRFDLQRTIRGVKFTLRF